MIAMNETLMLRGCREFIRARPYLSTG